MQGLDICNIRRVVQFLVPASLSQWLQRYGRAGRDGQPSVVVLLVQPSVYKKVKDHGKTSGESEGDADGSGETHADGDPMHVFQKDVEEGLREWIMATGCRRDVADKYFGNPACARRGTYIISSRVSAV